LFKNTATSSGLSCAFSCESGYTPSGTATCRLGQFEVGPQCTPNACSDDPGISLSNTRCTSNNHGSVCEPMCNNGYVLSPSSVTCTLGTWSEATCVPQSCDHSVNIEFMNAATACSSGDHGFECDGFECREGYSTQSKPICQFGEWVFNECVPDSCTSIPNVSNGDVQCTASEQHGTTCPVICHSGFTHSSSSTNFQCHLGKWVNQVFCAPNPCIGNPSIFDLDQGLTQCDSTLSSSSCELTCRKGFSPSVSSVMCLNGEWQTHSVSCDADACTSSPIIQNSASHDCGGAESGSFCDYTCSQGYVSLSLCLFHTHTHIYIYISLTTGTHHPHTHCDVIEDNLTVDSTYSQMITVLDLDT